MKGTIENLWNGNIAPGESCGEQNEEIAEILSLMENNVEDLRKVCSERQKQMLEKYIDCAEEYVYLITAQAFCDGFCLASKLLTEALT